jgi:ABC-2 type transport system permease protein
MTGVRTADVIGVSETAGTIREDLRAVGIIWQREMIRFLRDHIRMATSMVQPILFLFVLGTGLSPLVSNGSGRQFDFRTFMFPGVIAMTVLFTSVMSAMSIVWDREFGFLREMLVAPVRRGAIVLGKCLGGATVAGIQGTVILALAGFVHVPYTPALLATIVLELLIMAFTMSALGIVVASRVEQMQSFGIVVQFLVMPMFLLSGAIFPLNHLPIWLTVLAAINPVSYAVEPMRRAILAAAGVPASISQQLNPGIVWAGWRLPVGFELGILAAIGVLMLGVAITQFSSSN